jgi:SAM-dependent methyltransferase
MMCPICNSPMGAGDARLFGLPSVTSDCRPWTAGRSVMICTGCGVMRRQISDKFNPNIYANYRSTPEPAGRTKRILDFLDTRMRLRMKHILDIGCGTGDGLVTLADHFPFATVAGYEPHGDNSPPDCDNIIGIWRKRPQFKYDLVTMFQVFEHLDDIHETLEYVKTIIAPGGQLLIQVPYAAMWPFDLLISDHLWHFTANSLAELMIRGGFHVRYLGNDCIAKEITLLVDVSGECGEFQVAEMRPYIPSIEWLLAYKAFLDGITHKVAVFGTGPAAAWAADILGDRALVHLDDDCARRVGRFNGRTVTTPTDCQLPVVAPFPGWQLEGIQKKHPELKFMLPL